MTRDRFFDGRFTPRPNVLAREVGGEMVLLDPHRGVYYGLNEVGTQIWALLAEGKTAEEIEQRILAEYEVPADALRGDLERLFSELAEHGLIDRLDG